MTRALSAVPGIPLEPVPESENFSCKAVCFLTTTTLILGLTGIIFSTVVLAPVVIKGENQTNSSCKRDKKELNYLVSAKTWGANETSVLADPKLSFEEKAEFLKLSVFSSNTYHAIFPKSNFSFIQAKKLVKRAQWLEVSLQTKCRNPHQNRGALRLPYDR